MCVCVCKYCLQFLNVLYWICVTEGTETALYFDSSGACWGMCKISLQSVVLFLKKSNISEFLSCKNTSKIKKSLPEILVFFMVLVTKVDAQHTQLCI